MGEYHIIGGNRLEGQVKVHGGKNAILPILASVVLNKGKCVIRNCPQISDTQITIKILEAIGCKVTVKGSVITVDSSTANNSNVPENLVKEMRSSIIFLGALLTRFGKVSISYPGGCRLGIRPINFHLKGLSKLGAEINEDGGFINCTATKLVGDKINLDFPSVGATQNIMLAAVKAKGHTVISNAAKEPEIVELQNFLNGMGAKIKGAGTGIVAIEGVDELRDVDYTVDPDRIVAGTYLAAAAITKGEIELVDIEPSKILSVTAKLRETGCKIKEGADRVYLKAPKKLRPVDIITQPYPGFPTDMQAQMMSLLCLAEGSSVINETVFESRTMHINELKKMGADITNYDGTNSVIKGVKQLKGATVEATDLRGGAALIIAGLAAEGKTVVTNSYHVERGYENIEKILSSLGANIEFKP